MIALSLIITHQAIKMNFIIVALFFIDFGCCTNPLKKFFFKFEHDEGVDVKLKRQALRCDEDQLVLQLANLGVMSPDRLVAMSTIGNLDEMCQKVFLSCNTCYSKKF